MVSSSVLKLRSGDVIQIRSGVLQGIGPAGPTGPVGPQGEQGIQGAQGVPGPTGQVDQFLTYAHSIGNAQNLSPSTLTSLSLATVVRDDPGLVTALTQLTLPAGPWYLQASATFQKPSSASASGYRRLSLLYNGTEWDAASQNAIPGADTTFGLRTLIPVSSPGLVATFQAFHSDTVAIPVTVKFFITKLGPGAVGPQGSVGPAGPQGPIGNTGPIGPAGTLVDNTTTFANIGG